MQLARCLLQGAPRLGVVSGDEVIVLPSADQSGPADMRSLLRDLKGHGDQLRHSVDFGDERIPLAAASLLPPVEDPRHFLAVGLNYRDHAREVGVAIPSRPRLFTKLAGTLAGPRQPIVAPSFSRTLDYEGELAIVMGQPCHGVSRERALEYVAGYMIVNDLSLREYVNPDLLVLGKGCAGFAPCGPWISTADAVEDPQSLQLETWVNGELRQSSNTSEMVFPCAALIEWISRAVALEPGDVILTGSPPGSGVGFDPPRYLQPGDRVRIRVEGLGQIENTIVAESP